MICPERCLECYDETVICQNNINPRLTLPTRISSNVRKLTTINQPFSNPVLTSKNFTKYAPPHISLKQLIIRNCQIGFIESHAFSSLTKLDSLDLSMNTNLTIKDDAFHGLGLRILLLNNMKSLHLSQHSFRGLKVTSLSLIDSGLKTLSYDLLHPLARSLSKLFLQNNLITTMEPRISLIFEKLHTLDLLNNPLNCQCELQWLVRFYKQHINSSSNSNTFNKPKETIIPKCHSPTHLANKLISHIKPEEIVCDEPQITILDLKLDSKNQPAQLTCTGMHKAWLAPLQISWLNKEQIMTSESFISTQIASKTISVDNINDLGQYKCFLNNSLGSTFATVNINWVAFNSNNKIDSKSSTNMSREHKRSWKETFFERRFTLLEILAAITGTVVFTGILFLLMHKLVFVHCFETHSLSDDINAPYWFKRNKKISDKHHNYHHHQNNNNNNQPMAGSLSLTSTNCAQNDGPIYSSNSQTYDQPGPPYHTGSNLYLPTTPAAALSSNHQLLTQSYPSCQTLSQPIPSQQFLDFKTQRKIYRKI